MLANAKKIVESGSHARYTRGEVVTTLNVARAKRIVVSVADFEKGKVVIVSVAHTENGNNQHHAFVVIGGEDRYRAHEKRCGSIQKG